MCLTLQYYLKINQIHCSQDEVTFILTHKYAPLSDPKCGYPTDFAATQDLVSVSQSPCAVLDLSASLSSVLWHLRVGIHTLGLDCLRTDLKENNVNMEQC
jgi:hypothetical protein